MFCSRSFLALLLCGVSLADAQSKPLVAIELSAVDADFAIQGEYSGTVQQDGESRPFGAQIIALGGGKFQGVGYPGGLPGDGYVGQGKHEAQGKVEDGTLKLMTDQASVTVKNGVMIVQNANGQKIGELQKVERKSPTLGAKPPAGAKVLFDGTSADAFEGGRLSDDHLLMQGVTSKLKFQAATVHLEFLLSYMPEARGQGRANSGCYLQGRYEVQILDSFGLEGLNNECGGIYSIKAPDVNMCYPPLSWQTYDIDFTPAKYDAAGQKTADARMTVRHNGVVIHKDVALPKSTTAAPVKEGPEPGPLYLQDHGNPVRFRNIWIVEN